jgi:hypothetical protein
MNETTYNRKFTRRQIIIRLIFLVIYLILLYYLYWILIDLRTYPFIAVLILIFAFLLFLGVLLKKRGESFFSQFKRKKPILPDYSKSEKPRVRRIDLITLDSKYRKPIVRKCPKCGMQLAGFVKKCPNCGEEMLMT